MPANIEVFGQQATFVSYRELAWHRLGTVVEEATSAKEMLEIAHLTGWDVRTVPLFGGTDGIPMPNGQGVIRNNPFTGTPEGLAVVGNNYTPIQNEQSVEILDYIVDESGAQVQTAGSIDEGRKVFVSVKLPEGVLIDNQDAHDLYLLFYNSHDGSSALTLAVTPVRVVCQNTLTMALADTKQKFTLRHTGGVQGRIQEAREALRLTYAYRDEFEREMDRLLNEDMPFDRFAQSVARELFPINMEASEGWQRRTANKRLALMQVFEQGMYNVDQSMWTTGFGRGTKYAAFNAVTEFADWFTPVRGDLTARANRQMSGAMQAFKDRGLALVKAA